MRERGAREERVDCGQFRDSDVPVFVIRYGQSGTPAVPFFVITVDEKQAKGTPSTAAEPQHYGVPTKRFHPDSRQKWCGGIFAPGTGITWNSLVLSGKTLIRGSVQRGGREIKTGDFRGEPFAEFFGELDGFVVPGKSSRRFFCGFPASRLAVQYCCNGVQQHTSLSQACRLAVQQWRFNRSKHLSLSLSHLHLSSNFTTDRNHRQEKQHLPRLVHHPEAPLRARKSCRKHAKPGPKNKQSQRAIYLVPSFLPNHILSSERRNTKRDGTLAATGPRVPSALQNASH